MKTKRVWSRSFLLPLFGLITLSLASCQEKEVIELIEEDLAVVDSEGEVFGEFDLATATDFLYDADGEHIGYVDNEGNVRDLNGNPRHSGGGKGLLAKDDYPYDLEFALYNNEDFTNPFLISMIPTSRTHDWSRNYPDLESENPSRADGIRAIVLKKGCYAELFSERNYNGSRHYLGARPQERYRSTPFDIKSMKVWCSGDNVVDFCGFVYEGEHHTGNKLPYFVDTDIVYEDRNEGAEIYELDYWNDRIESISDNAHNNNCPGVMLYDDATDSEAGKYAWHEGTDHVSTFLPNLTSRLLTTSRIGHRWDNLDFDIGAVFYKEADFKGHVHIVRDSTTTLVGDINSYILPPGCTVTVEPYDGTQEYTLNPGYHRNGTLKKGDNIIVECNNQISNYCGTVVFNEAVGAPHLPIFTDTYLDLKLASPNVWDNKIVGFQPTDRPTTCAGVTFWENSDGPQEGGQRTWAQVNPENPQSTSVPPNISHITAEMPSAENSGLDPDVWNAFASRYNEWTILLNNVHEHSPIGTKRELTHTYDGMALDMLPQDAMHVPGVVGRAQRWGMAAAFLSAFGSYTAQMYFGWNAENLGSQATAIVQSLPSAYSIGVWVTRAMYFNEANQVNEAYARDIQSYGRQLIIHSAWTLMRNAALKEVERLAAIRLADLAHGVIVKEQYLDLEVRELTWEDFGHKWIYASQENLMETDPANIEFKFPTEVFVDAKFSDDYLVSQGASQQWLTRHSRTLSAMMNDQALVEGRVSGQAIYSNVVTDIGNKIREGTPRPDGVPEPVWDYFSRVTENQRISNEVTMTIRVLSTPVSTASIFSSSAVGTVLTSLLCTGTGWCIQANPTEIVEGNATTTIEGVLDNQTVIPTLNTSSEPTLLVADWVDAFKIMN